MENSEEVSHIMNILEDDDELEGIPENVKSLIKNYQPKKPGHGHCASLHTTSPFGKC